ncbi:MAG: peptidylprolyl isomerase [Thermoleophilia bacterium]|nr:peptidylprolyl isomerase [Thermoleophilia bacterium]
MTRSGVRARPRARRLPVLLLALTSLLAACGGNGDDGGEAEQSPDECASAEAPGVKDADAPPKPTAPLDPGQTHRLVFDTTCGEFTVELDPEQAPQATASLVSLARSGYFDGTLFHRVVPGFVIQGGDPTGTGSGGPGYSTEDRPAAETQYTEGVVAMAKTQTEPPGTAGSQFFVVTAADAGLPPEYAVVGRVAEGMDTVRRIEALGDAQTQQPFRPILIEKVTVESE